MQLLKIFGLFCILGISALAQTADADKVGKIEEQTLGTETTIAFTTEHHTKSTAFFLTPPDFFYKKPIATSTKSITTTKYPKHIRTLISPSSTLRVPKYTRILPTTIQHNEHPVQSLTTLLPRSFDCIAVCIENALVFADCIERNQDCVCNDAHYRKVLYHCLTAVCESKQLASAVEFVTNRCFPYLTPNQDGEFVLFQDTEVHDQDELHQLYARKYYGSGTVSGARPAGPTFPPTNSYKHLPIPRVIRGARVDVQGVDDVEVVISTIVTEYADASSRPSATEGLWDRKRNEKKRAHKHKGPHKV